MIFGRQIIAAAAFAYATVAGAASTSQVIPVVWTESEAPGQLVLDPAVIQDALDIKAYVISRAGLPVLVWEKPSTGVSTIALPSIPFATAGFYRLQINDITQSAKSSSLTLSVVPRPLARVTGVPLFGVNVHFSQRTIPDIAYDLLRSANVDLVRDQWVWPSVEKSTGMLRVPTSPNGGVSHSSQMLIRHGLKVLHNCAYGNPLYDGGQFPTSPVAMAAFAKYCSFVGQQYGAALFGSEIWNESNKIDAVKVYAPLALITSNLLKQDLPSTEIIQGGGAGPGGGIDPIYEEQVYHATVPSCCTGASIHPYMPNPDVGYFASGARLNNPVTGQSIGNLDFATFWLDYLDHSVNKPHSSHITEIGWSTANDGKSGVSEEKQAAFISRTLILVTKPSACTLDVGSKDPNIVQVCFPTVMATAPDLKSLFIYDFIDDGSDLNNLENNFGLLHTDLSPKMSYSAYAQASSILRGSTFHKKFQFSDHSLANAFLYKSGANTGWLVLWTTEFKPQGIIRSAAAMQYSITARTQASVLISGPGGSTLPNMVCREWDGHACTLNAGVISISNLPVYIQIQGSLDDWNVVDQSQTSPMPPQGLSTDSH